LPASGDHALWYKGLWSINWIYYKYDWLTSKNDLLIPITNHFWCCILNHKIDVMSNSLKGRVICRTKLHNIDMIFVKWNSNSINCAWNNGWAWWYNLLWWWDM
jgi:hypothetical protein